MSLIRRIVTLSFIALLITSCDYNKPSRTEQFFVEGMVVAVTIYGEDDNKIDQATQQLKDEFTRIYGKLSVWHDSPLSQINLAIANRLPATTDTELLTLIQRAQYLEQVSDGLFNPAIGALVALWGFHHDPLPEAPPTQQLIAELIQSRPSMSAISIANGAVTSNNATIKLDFGGFAEGYALQLAETKLRSLGIKNAMINAAGDIRTLGKHGDRPWRVGIRNPSGNGALAAIETQGDETIETSGNYERFFVANGKHYHHILDPRTGYPTSDTQAVTLIGNDPVIADAAATALMVAGPNDCYRIAKKMGIRFVMLIDINGIVHMNPEMASRVSFQVDPAPKIILGPSL